MPKEIERRFLLTQLPRDFVLHPSYYTQQAYMRTDEATKTEERVRYRLTPGGHESFLRCRKQGSGLARIEVETPLSRLEFAQGLVNCLGSQIRKRVYYEMHDLRWIELHIFMSHQPLMTIEVEFSTEADASSYIPPDWFGREVTDDRRYNSASVALNGVPSDFSTSNEMMMLFHGEVLEVKPPRTT